MDDSKQNAKGKGKDTVTLLLPRGNRAAMNPEKEHQQHQTPTFSGVIQSRAKPVGSWVQNLKFKTTQILTVCL